MPLPKGHVFEAHRAVFDKNYITMLFYLSFQAGSSPVSSISGFSVGSGRVDDANDEDFKVTSLLFDSMFMCH